VNGVWENAAKNAKPDCPRCHGKGTYQYSTHGTPHFTICNLCCLHNMGWWTLPAEHYGDKGGHLCCRAGCGATKLPE
jgi:hypothetical protein